MSAYEQEVKNRVKLPATVRPSKYTLNIHVDLTKFEFRHALPLLLIDEIYSLLIKAAARKPSTWM
jgi:hypothetical protein